MEEDENSNENPPKSLVCERFALVTFTPRTDRQVNIFWLDYNGRRVKYGTMPRGAELHVTTFETHPWVFHDAETGDRLVTSSKEKVYYPVAWTGEHRQTIFIDIPVFSLKERCLQVIRSQFDVSRLEKDQLPYTLTAELMRSRQVPFDVHMYFEPVI